MGARCTARRQIIRDQIAGADPHDAPWGASVIPGSPVSVLAEASNAADVDLLVVGMPGGRETPAFRDDTALRVMRRSAKPVVAVADTIRVPPRHCIVAVDFTRSSLHAARAALSILEPDGTLVLAHVQPELEGDDPTLHAAYVKAVAAAFARVRRELHPAAGVRIEHVLLEGQPRAALAALCDRVGTDLIAMGTLHFDVARLHRGRLSTSFLRAGTRSVLVAPPDPRQ